MERRSLETLESESTYSGALSGSGYFQFWRRASARPAKLGASLESATDGFYSHYRRRRRVAWRRLSTIAALVQADRNGREAKVIYEAARGPTADRRDKLLKQLRWVG
jgi:hypothetical protein